MPAVAFADMGEVVSNAIHHAILELSFLNLVLLFSKNAVTLPLRISSANQKRPAPQRIHISAAPVLIGLTLRIYTSYIKSSGGPRAILRLCGPFLPLPAYSAHP